MTKASTSTSALGTHAGVSRRHVPSSRGLRLRRGLTLPLLGLLAWWAAFAFHWTSSTFYVPVGKVLAAAWTLSVDGELWSAVAASLLRALGGFSLALLGGVGLGAWLGVSRLPRRLLEPSLRIPAGISTFAWIPLIIAWFGLGEPSKIVFIAIAGFFPIFINTLDGVTNIPRLYIEVARVFRFSPWQLFTKIILPAALPSIFSGVYVALIGSWGATLAAEYLMTSSDGVGRLLIDGQQSAQMDQAILAAVVAGAIGFALHRLASGLETHLLGARAPEASHAAPPSATLETIRE